MIDPYEYFSSISVAATGFLLASMLAQVKFGPIRFGYLGVAWALALIISDLGARAGLPLPSFRVADSLVMLFVSSVWISTNSYLSAHVRDSLPPIRKDAPDFEKEAAIMELFISFERRLFRYDTRLWILAGSLAILTALLHSILPFQTTSQSAPANTELQNPGHERHD